MDFDFGTLFENSRRLKSGQSMVDEDQVEDYFDDYYSDEDESDSDAEWMEEYRQKKASRRLKIQFGIEPPFDEEGQIQEIDDDDTNPNVEETIAQGQQLLMDFYSKAATYQEKYYQSANIKPIEDDFFPFENKEKELEAFLKNELYDMDEEEGTSSLDPNVFEFRRDEIVLKTIQLLEQAYSKDPQNAEKHLYRLYYSEFISNFKDWKYKYHRLSIFAEINNNTNKPSSKIKLNKELINILNFEEPVGPLNNVNIIYLTSGGGKSVFFKKYRNFLRLYDVDEFIKNHYTSFKDFQQIIKGVKNSQGIMSLWFKYHLHEENKSGKLNNVILLFNHPNQIPIYFRKKHNEMIIFPTKLNWDVRFFKENFFSLAHVKGKHTVILEYKQYAYYILTFLRRNFGRDKVNLLVKKNIFGFKHTIASK